MSWSDVLSGLVAFGGLSGVASLIGVLNARRAAKLDARVNAEKMLKDAEKAPAERDAVIVDTASHVVAMLREQLDDATRKVDACGERLEELGRKLREAEQQAAAAQDTAARLDQQVRQRDQTIQTLRERVDELERRTNDGSTP